MFQLAKIRKIRVKRKPIAEKYPVTAKNRSKQSGGWVVVI